MKKSEKVANGQVEHEVESQGTMPGAQTEGKLRKEMTLDFAERIIVLVWPCDCQTLEIELRDELNASLLELWVANRRISLYKTPLKVWGG